MLVPPSLENQRIWMCNSLGIQDESELIEGFNGGITIDESQLERKLNLLTRGQGDYDILHLFGNPGNLTYAGWFYWNRTPFHTINFRYDQSTGRTLVDFNVNSEEPTRFKLTNPNFIVKEVTTGPQELYGPGKYEDTAELTIFSGNIFPPSLFIIKMGLFKNMSHVEGYVLNTENTQPWEMGSSHITVIDVYEAQIIGEDRDCYDIKFSDEEMEPVEAGLDKKEFTNWPHPVTINTAFGLVVYKYRGKERISAWPLEEYWNKELLE